MGRRVSDEIKREVEQKRDFFELKAEKGKAFDYKEIFGNDNPVYLEIGSGRGEFIVTQSLLEWNVNFIGVEIDPQRFDLILRQLDKDRHKNVRMLKLFMDAESIKYFPENSLQKVFIIHPDPWPKRRHHPRRLINHKFLDMLFKILKPRGFLEIQTDHAEYAQWICRHLKEREDFVAFMGGVSNIPRHKHIVTYFEEKKLREGYEINYISYRAVE